ncbi:MAG: hypothetical protein Q4B50_07660 [Bacillota bacterium]|nr:hypothetical protein [Bacillota bacterium]
MRKRIEALEKHAVNCVVALNDKKEKKIYSELFGEHLSQVGLLHEKLDHLCRPDENGQYPRMKKGEMEELRAQYIQVITTARKLKQLEALKDLTEKLTEELISDFPRLSVALDEEGRSLPEILSRRQGYGVDVSNQSAFKYGVYPDGRIPMNFDCSLGKNVEGFFTNKESPSRNREEAFLKGRLELAEEIMKEHPSYGPAIVNLLCSESFGQDFSTPEKVEAQLLEFSKKKDISKIFNKYIGNIENMENSEEYLDSLTQDESFSRCVLKILEKFAALRTKRDELWKAGIERSASLDARSRALGELADVLGVSGIVERTVEMRTFQHGVGKRGSFSEKAEGSDLFHLEEDDPAVRVEEKGLNTPSALKSISELQMLDYICGVQQRRQEKMRYQFEEQGGEIRLCAVRGCANSCSFRKGDSESKELMGLMVISRRMADRIKDLEASDIEKLLERRGLSQREKEAALLRYSKVKQELAFNFTYPKDQPAYGMLVIVEDADWAQLDLDKLSLKENSFPTKKKDAGDEEKELTGGDLEKKNPLIWKDRGKNYFDIVRSLPHVVKEKQQKQAQSQQNRKEIEKRFPELKKELCASAMGSRLDELNAYGVLNNQRRFVILSRQLLDANAGFFVGSTEFRQLMNSFQAACTSSMRAHEGMKIREMRELQGGYRDLIEKTEAYLSKKRKEETALRAKGKEPSTIAKKRVAFAQKLRSFVAERIDGMEFEMELVALQKQAIAKKSVIGCEEELLSKAGSKPEKDKILTQFAARKNLVSNLTKNDKFKRKTDGKTRTELEKMARRSGKELQVELELSSLDMGLRLPAAAQPKKTTSC